MQSSDYDCGDRAISEGVAAAEHWPDFARDSAATKVNQTTASAEQSMGTVGRALIERSADNVG